MLEMDLAWVQEICSEMREAEFAWTPFLDSLEQKILTPAVESGPGKDNGQRKQKHVLADLQSKQKKFLKLIFALEKSLEAYRAADARAYLLVQQDAAVNRQGTIRLNDLSGINQKMEQFQIRTTED